MAPAPPKGGCGRAGAARIATWAAACVRRAPPLNPTRQRLVSLDRGSRRQDDPSGSGAYRNRTRAAAARGRRSHLKTAHWPQPSLSRPSAECDSVSETRQRPKGDEREAFVCSCLGGRGASHGPDSGGLERCVILRRPVRVDIRQAKRRGVRLRHQLRRTLREPAELRSGCRCAVRARAPQRLRLAACLRRAWESQAPRRVNLYGPALRGGLGTPFGQSTPSASALKLSNATRTI
jgi:hypothetical protein